NSPERNGRALTADSTASQTTQPATHTQWFSVIVPSLARSAMPTFEAIRKCRTRFKLESTANHITQPHYPTPANPGWGFFYEGEVCLKLLLSETSPSLSCGSPDREHLCLGSQIGRASCRDRV